MLEIEGMKTVLLCPQDPSATVGEMPALDCASLGFPGPIVEERLDDKSGTCYFSDRLVRDAS